MRSSLWLRKAAKVAPSPARIAHNCRNVRFESVENIRLGGGLRGFVVFGFDGFDDAAHVQQPVERSRGPMPSGRLMTASEFIR